MEFLRLVRYFQKTLEYIAEFNGVKSWGKIVIELDKLVYVVPCSWWSLDCSKLQSFVFYDNYRYLKSTAKIIHQEDTIAMLYQMPKAFAILDFLDAGKSDIFVPNNF